MRRALAFAVAGVVALAGCTAPYDGDGEAASGRLAPAAAVSDDARRVLVDTDLGSDDLVALALLVRRPDVRVVAVTVAATGLVGCEAGVDLVADLVATLGARPVPVGCGRATAGPGGRALPEEWRERAATGPGLPDRAGPGALAGDAVPVMIRAARAAGRSDAGDGLTVVALGPATNLADLAAERPAVYARLAAVHLMAGAVDAPAVDGVAEWNAAADPAALRTVLASAGPPLTVVPDDAVPTGTPAAVAGAPTVGSIAAVAGIDRWWDLAAAAALVAPDAVEAERGAWSVDDTGRLGRTGPGRVRVVRSLDQAALAAAYSWAFAPGLG